MMRSTCSATPIVPPGGQEPEPDPKSGRAKLHASGCQCHACVARLAADPVADELDRLADDALADWIDITDPVLAPLRAILARATTLEEVQAMLAAVDTDTTALVEALATMTAIARGLGDTGDDLPAGD